MAGEAVPQIDVGGFDSVDSSSSPERFASWMDHQRAQVDDRLLVSLDLNPDDVVLDIGCGTGIDLDAVSSRTRRAVGIDLSEAMVNAAKERAATGKFVLAVADGQRLPFPPASFDAVSSRAVLVHTPQPELTVAEMRRVLKPGGRAVLSEPDHGSHIVATSELDVFERVRLHRRTTFRNPLIGRSLVELSRRAGLTVTNCRAFPIVHRSLDAARAAGGPFGVAVDAAVAAGAISVAEAERYNESLLALDRHNSFFFAAMSVRITATAR